MLFCFNLRIQTRLPLVAMFLLAHISLALEPATPLSRLSRQAWTIENGLPQNTVPFLLQSRNGFLWIGTEAGLARFDGYAFQTFDHATTRGFPNAEVRCLLETRSATPLGDDTIAGAIWIGTGDGLVRWLEGRPSFFSTREGLPSNAIQGLVQTSDGTLWVNTEQGMAHWNGQKFQVAPTAGSPAGLITSMAADGTGGLWVGTPSGVAVLRQGKWLSANQFGISSSQTASLVNANANGDVLVANGDGAFLLSGGKFSTVLEKGELPREAVSFLRRLSNGTIAVASKSVVVVIHPRQASAPNANIERFMIGKDFPGSRIEVIYPDREASLWIGTNHGMARLSMEGATASEKQAGYSVQLLPTSDPLASNAVVSFLEDREGDLWVGAETAGLQIFRESRFRTLGTREGLSSDATTAIIEDRTHFLWIGTRDSGVNRITEDTATGSKDSPSLPAIVFNTAGGLVSNVVLALASAPNGDVWVGTPDGLNRIHQESGRHQISTFTSADGLPDDFIRSLLCAEDGSLWVGTRRGLTHLDHSHFHTFTQLDGLGSDLVGAMVETHEGDLWIATLNGLSRMHKGAIRNYTTADGLPSNVITALDVTPDGTLWIGTQDQGLALWDSQWNGGQVVAFPDHASSTNSGTSTEKQIGELPADIHALLHDDREHLWIASDSGLTRVDIASLMKSARGGAVNLNAIHFTTADGLRSRETSKNSHPTASRSSDGRLWFTTPKGLIIVDPLQFAEIPGPPPVVIERFAVDDRTTDETSPGAFPIAAGHLRFQFDYAGLSFAAPQKLRYQYMLEGFDHEWTDAGTRRTAYYTNIPPGPYRFRVRATLGDAGFSYASNLTAPSAMAPGSATHDAPIFPEADLSFELLPHFYQTAWFRVALLLAIAAVVVWIFRRRIRRVRREFSVVMAERNRIAREIHDTLAQGYVGISLQLEVLGELLRHDRAEAAAKHLAATQALVREGLDDARQSIWALRSQDGDEHNLPVRLRRLVEKAQTPELSASLEVHGAYRALDTNVEKEILRIAQEAIQNVKRHASANQVHVHLDYDERALSLIISDDGKGFVPPPVLGSSKPDARSPVASNGNSGHYGLTGMLERAALIRGELSVISEPGSGTTVSLRIAAPEASARNRSDSSTAAQTMKPAEDIARKESSTPHLDSDSE